jgi:hypothetical protein
MLDKVGILVLLGIGLMQLFSSPVQAEIFIVTGGNYTQLNLTAVYNITDYSTSLETPNPYYCALNEFTVIPAYYRNFRRDTLTNATLKFNFENQSYIMDYDSNQSRWVAEIMSNTIGNLSWTINASLSPFQNQSNAGACKVMDAFTTDVHIWADTNMTTPYFNEFGWIIAESKNQYCDMRPDRSDLTLNKCYFVAPYSFGYARLKLFEPTEQYNIYLVEGTLAQPEPYAKPAVTSQPKALIRNWKYMGTYNLTKLTYRIDLYEQSVDFSAQYSFVNSITILLKLFAALAVFIFVFYISGDLTTAFIISGLVTVGIFGATAVGWI